MNKTKLLLLPVVALMATSCVSSKKYKKLEADKGALETQVGQLQKDREQLAAEKAALEASGKETESQYQNLVGQLSQEVQEGQLKVTQYKNMLTVDVAEQIFFASGSAKLKKSGQDVLKKVGDALVQYNDKIIRVVGHTDNVPLAKSLQNVFPTNWELSVMRATNVVRFLQDECKIDPKNLIASGRGEYGPVAPNDTPEGRQKNRRIEIMLLDKQMVENMGQRIKRILIILAVAVFAAAAGVVVLSRKINPATVKPRIESALSNLYGEAVTIQKISWRWFPKPYFLASGLTLPKRESGPAFQIPEIRITLDIRQILKKKIVLDKVEIFRPIIFLSPDKKGRYLAPRSVRAPQPGAEDELKTFFMVDLHLIKVTDASVKLMTPDQPNAAQKTRITVNGKMNFSAGEPTRPFEFQANVASSGAQANLTLTGTLGSKVTVNLVSKKAPISCFSEWAPTLRSFTGFADAEAHYGVNDAIAQWNLRGTLYELKIKDLSDSPVGKGTLSMDSDGPGLLTLNIESPKTKALIHVDIPNSKVFPIEVTIEADPVNWMEVRSWKGFNMTQRTKDKIDEEKILFKADLKNIQFEKGTIEEVNASALKAGTTYQLDRSEIKAFGGEAALSGILSDDRFEARWSAARLDAGPMQTFLGARQALSGEVQSIGLLSGSRPIDLPSLNGSFFVQASQGALFDAPGTLKFISSLNMTSFLKSGKKSDQKELPFDTLSATVSVRNGILFFEKPATFESSTLQMACKGTADLPGNRVELKVVVNFLDVASEIVKLVPGVRTIILGGRPTLIPLFVNVNGPLDNPKVDVESTKSISKGAWGTVTSVLKFPVELTESIFSHKKKEEEPAVPK